MTLSMFRTLRRVVVALGLAAGALLLATGHLLLGAVIGGLAVLRLVLTLGRPRRHAGNPLPVLRTLACGQFEVAAGAIGVAPSDLRVEFAKGRSIAEVAGAEGVRVDAVVAAVVADASAKVDRAVADGQTPPAVAARIKGRLPQWATRLVNGHRGELRMQVSASR